MLFNKSSRYSPRRLIVLVLCLSTVGYFAYHVFGGEYGWRALQRLRAEQVELRAELDQKRAQRQMMELRVTLMRPESLDPDMLDERAREALNLAHPHDITILRAVR